LQNSRKQTW